MGCDNEYNKERDPEETPIDVSEIDGANVISSPSGGTNCKGRSDEFWSNVEENLKVYNRLTLCITETNGIEEVPNTKPRPQRDIHVGDLSVCDRKNLRYNVHISYINVP